MLGTYTYALLLFFNEAENVAEQYFKNITYQFEITSPERNVFIGSSLASFDLCTLATEFFGNCGGVGNIVRVISSKDALPSYVAPED